MFSVFAKHRPYKFLKREYSLYVVASLPNCELVYSHTINQHSIIRRNVKHTEDECNGGADDDDDDDGSVGEQYCIDELIDHTTNCICVCVWFSSLEFYRFSHKKASVQVPINRMLLFWIKNKLLHLDEFVKTPFIRSAAQTFVFISYLSDYDSFFFLLLIRSPLLMFFFISCVTVNVMLYFVIFFTVRSVPLHSICWLVLLLLLPLLLLLLNAPSDYTNMLDSRTHWPAHAHTQILTLIRVRVAWITHNYVWMRKRERFITLDTKNIVFFL